MITREESYAPLASTLVFKKSEAVGVVVNDMGSDTSSHVMG